MSDSPAYSKRRSHLISTGRWDPWADPGPARSHVEVLRSYGGRWEAIGRAAGVGNMTAWALANGKGRIRQATARRILSVTPAGLGLTRIPAGGSMWRLRSLMAMGHSIARMGRALDEPADLLSRIINAGNATVSVALAARINQLLSAWWDKSPPGRSPQEKQAATKARTRAAAENWPTPANLDEDELDLPGYRPRFGWRFAAGTGEAGDYPLGFPGEAA